jgi:hypothetical protein
MAAGYAGYRGGLRLIEDIYNTALATYRAFVGLIGFTSHCAAKTTIYGLLWRFVEE